MDVNNSLKTTPANNQAPVKVEPKGAVNNPEIIQEKVVKNTTPVIPLKDILSVDNSPSGKAGVISFVDEKATFDERFNPVLNLKDYSYFGQTQQQLFYTNPDNKFFTTPLIIKPEAEVGPKNTYDQKTNTTTIESANKKNITKTKYDDKNKILSAEVINGSSKSNVKFTGSFDGKSSELKPLGFEVTQDSTNIKAQYDPKAQGFSTELKTGNETTNFKITSDYDAKNSEVKGVTFENNLSKDTSIRAGYTAKEQQVSAEISQNIDSTNFKINSNYDTKSANLKQIGLETSRNGTSLKTSYNPKESAVAAEISAGSPMGKVKLSSDYNVQSANINKVGLEYGLKDFKVSTSYINLPIDGKKGSPVNGRSLEMKMENSFGEINTAFSVDKPGLSKVQFAKPVSFGKDAPEMKFSAEYSNEYFVGDKDSRRYGLGIEAKVADRASLTYSSKFGESNIHSIGVKYHILDSTDFTLDANINDKDPSKAGLKAMFNTGFKF